MSTALAVALLAATVTALGWLANYVLTTKADRRRREASALLEHVERQLAELYGPLAFLVIEGQQTFRDLLASLGRRFVFPPSGELGEDELQTWLFWAENDLLPRNAEIKRILMTHAHLIDGGEMPATYVQFLDHHNSWQINHLRWQKQGVPYPWHSKVNWPDTFTRDVLDTFRRLKATHAALVGKNAGAADAAGS